MFAESPFAAWLAARINAQPARPPTAALAIPLTVSPEKDVCVCARIALHNSLVRAGAGAIAEAVFSG
jgi:hypothetical protein